MLTITEKKEQDIRRAARAGAIFSRYCRNAWTGERTRPSLEVEKVTYWPYLAWVSKLGDKPLLAYENIADLHQFRLGRPDQHTWDEARWEQEIRRIRE